MKLEELRVYTKAMEIGEIVWKVVDGWNYFERDTMGKQLVRSVDSVAANISEGYGRFHFRESVNFGFYARGSLYETQTWLTKAYDRKLLGEELYQSIMSEIESLAKMLMHT